jgi:hypothetical protein
VGAVKIMIFEGLSREEREGTADVSIVDVGRRGGG